MREYLYNLLITVDRCDATSKDLTRVSRRNNRILRRMRRVQSGGGNGDYDELIAQIESSVSRTHALNTKLESVKEPQQETVDIAILITKFLGELHTLTQKPEYREIQTQVREITELLKPYVRDD